jgi:predicted enzyme related to lactoylglutathione lyase
MTTLTLNPPGTFCWIELGTPDISRARDFYHQLFGWSVVELPMGPDGSYYFLQKDGKDVAAMYQLTPDMKAQGVPPHWLSYVAVADADAAAKRAAELGGQVMKGPFDLGDHGRMAVLLDPQGGAFAIWQAKNGPGIQLRDEPGSLAWTELISTDAKRGVQFYSTLFGWGVQPMPMPGMEYSLFQRDDMPVGGAMQRLPEMGDLPTHWLPYFVVEDADNALDRARALGATTPMPVMEVEGVGRFATFIDPTGAALAILQPTRMQA